MSRCRALALGILGVLGLLLMVLVLFSGNASAADSGPLEYVGDAELAQAAVDGECTGSGTELDPYIFIDYDFECAGSAYGLWIKDTTSYVIIDNCTFLNCTLTSGDIQGYAVYLQNVSHATVRGNGFSNVNYGIVLSGSDNCTLIGNDLDSVQTIGISIGQSYWIVTELNFNDDAVATPAAAITVSSSQYVAINDTTLIGGIQGIYISGSTTWVIVHNSSFAQQLSFSINIESSSEIEISNSTFSNLLNYSIGVKAQVSAHVNVRNCRFDQTGLSSFGVDVSSCDQVSISNNRFNVTSNAVMATNAENITIEENLFTNCTEFTMMLRLTNGQLLNNTVVESRFGISLQYSSNVVVRGNELEVAQQAGFELYECHDMLVEDNYITFTLDSFNKHIFISFSSNCQILNNTALGYGNTAIAIYSSNGLLVSGNYMASVGAAGISLETVGGAEVLNNTVGTAPEYGLLIQNSYDLHLAGNILEGCTIHGISLDGSYDALVEENDVDLALSRGISVSSGGSYSNITIRNNSCLNTETGIVISEIGGVVAENNDCSFSSNVGIYFSHSTFSYAGNNTASNCGVGISLDDSPGCSVNGGIFDDCNVGVGIGNDGVYISNVSASSCVIYGLLLNNAPYSYISGSYFNGNTYGIVINLDASHNQPVFITDCFIENNTDRGLTASGGMFSEISGNHFANNVDYGVYLDTTCEMWFFFNNTFHENYYVWGINLDAYQAYDGGVNNNWYYFQGDRNYGNGWSNLPNVDLDEDGYVDYSIRIGPYNRYYPNQLPYGPKIEAPTAPTGMTGVIISPYVHLNWTEPASGGNATVINYEVYRGSAPDNLNLIGYSYGELFYMVSSDLMNGFTYYFAVKAVNYYDFTSDLSNVIEIDYTIFPPSNFSTFAIHSDQEFFDMDQAYGWQGDGSAADPYIIEDLTIDGIGYGYCVQIWDTTAHFIIRNCTFYFGDLGMAGNGIELMNVVNGLIIDSAFLGKLDSGIESSNSQYAVEGCDFNGSIGSGIYSNTDNDLDIANSTFQGCSSGLSIFYAVDVLVSGNTFGDYSYAVYAQSSDDIRLVGNYANGSRMFELYNVYGALIADNVGVGLDTFAYLNLVSVADVVNNSAIGADISSSGIVLTSANTISLRGNDIRGFSSGIYINGGDLLEVSNNHLSGNDFGLYLYSSASTWVAENNISGNLIFGLRLGTGIPTIEAYKNMFLDNFGYAVHVDSLADANFYLNLFSGNNGNDGTYDTTTVQVYDPFHECQWDLDGFGNYWADWTSPDVDGDGIVDEPYMSGDEMGYIDFFPLSRAFGAPTGLACDVGPDHVNLSWADLYYDFSEGVDGYFIYRGTAPDTYVLLASTTDMWYNDTMVTVGVEYFYRISAYIGTEEGALSGWISAIPSDVPGVPTGMTVAAGLHSFQLSWTAPADDGGSAILGYTIWRGVSPMTLVVIDTIGTNTAYTDLLVGDNETWYYAVAAFNQAGDGEISGIVGNTTFGYASVPLNVATQFGDRNVTVSWDAPLDDGGTPITGYVIEFGVYPMFDFAFPGASDRSWTITGLTNGLEYSFRVLADNVVLTGYYDIGAAWSSPAYDTPATVPDAPEELEATTATGEVRLSWLLPADDGGSAPILYNVFRMELGGTWASIGNSTSLMFEDPTVSVGAVYFYRVSAVNKAGEGNVSEPVRAVPGLPSPPMNLTASNSAGKVQLNWTAPADDGGSALQGYKIYRDGGSGFAYLGLVGPGSLGYLDTTAAPGIEYAYQVTAVSGNGEGPASNVMVITLPMVPPEAPVIDSAVQEADGVEIAWHVPESSTVPDEFMLYRGAAEDSLALIAIINGSMRGYLDIAGTAGAFYAMRSSNEFGVGDMSAAFQATLGIVIPPDAPQGLTAIPGDSLVTLNWIASQGAVGYNIYRDNGTGYALLATTSGTEYADGAAVNGVACHYRVTAYNDGGESGNSTTVLATPGTVPGTVQNLVLTEGEAIVTLDWEAPADNGGSPVQGYRVYRDLNGTVTLLAMVNTLTYTDHNVISGLPHTYWIVALNAWGAGAESVRLNVTPDEIAVTGIPAPSYLLAAVGNGTVTLTWDPMTSFGVDGFLLFRSEGGNFTLLAAQSGSSYTDTGLVNGETYVYRVHCFIGESSGENASVEATPGMAPGAPTLNGQVAVDRITLGWSVPEDGGSAIVGYRLYRTPGTGTTVLLASLTGTGYIDTTVLAGVNYTYMVTALNAFGEGSPSNTKVLRTSEQYSPSVDVPAEPYLSSVTGGNTSISLLWNVPSDTGDGPITGYNVYRGTTALAAQLLVSVPAGTTTYSDGTAVFGTTYYYWVSALNQWGEGELSRMLSASLIVLALPGEVDVDVTEGQGRITLSWDVPDEGSSSVTEYRIYRRGETGERQLIATVPAGTDTFVDGSVEAGSEYDYWVTAVNAAGEGPLADSPVSGVPLAVIAGEAEIGPLPMIALALGAIGLLVAVVAVVLVLRKK
ncbi:MAG: right-handed parallel beta-helix repeat-containing protein [Methanomassiliicoccales archaeon]